MSDSSTQSSDSQFRAATLIRRDDGTFVDLAEATAPELASRWIRGAIELTINGVPLLDRDLWDDVNWLWPMLIQSLLDCERTGYGERMFPSQPISIVARGSGKQRLTVSVSDSTVSRTAQGEVAAVLRTVGTGAWTFFSDLAERSPDAIAGCEEERAVAQRWAQLLQS